MAMRGLQDRQEVSVIAAGESMTVPRRRASRLVLDNFSRARYGADDSALHQLAERVDRVAPGTSLAVLVTGGGPTIGDIRNAAAKFGPDVRVVAIQVATGKEPDARPVGGMHVLTVPTLTHLRTALRKAGS
jgi:hypothetical protein